MEVEPFENPWIKKIRTLTHVLILSIAVNVGLGTKLMVSHFKEKEIAPDGLVHKEVFLKDSNGAVLKDYFALDMESLLRELNNKNLIQNGLLRRDLALSCLVNFHHLDLEKSLSGTVIQKRALSFVHQGGGEKFDIQVYQGLDDGHFQMIQMFAKREEWPLTVEGLFYEMAKCKGEPPSSLMRAFLATPEYYGIYILLQRTGEKIAFERVFKMIREGDWFTLKEIYKDQLLDPSQSEQGLRQVLGRYVASGSEEAAEIWIELEGEALVKQLADIQIIELIEVVKKNTPSSSIFLKRLLCSIRCDQIQEMAARKLYELKGIKAPVEYSHDEAMKVFLPALVAAPESPSTGSVPVRDQIHKKYRVTDGDSLWKIAKKHKVSIEGIRKINQLTTDRLKVGQELIIPNR